MFNDLTMIKKLHSIFARLSADDLIRHASILFSGMMVVHVCNMVFQMAVSRVLPDQEYTLLMAFLAVLVMIQRPLGTLRVGLSHYTSILLQERRSGDVRRLLRKWLVLMGTPSLILSALVLALSHSLTGFFHLERLAPVLITGAVLPVLFLTPVFSGAVQGLQAFKWGAGANMANALIRLGLGAGFVWFLYPACGWAMMGHGLGLYAGCAILFTGLVFFLRGKQKSTLPLPSLRFFLLQSFFIQAAYSILMTADVVLVKHYFPEDTEFAYAATLGRMVVFLPGAIVSAMFPKVASKGAGTQAQRAVFLKSFWISALFVAGAIGGCFLFSGLLARILFDKTAPSDYLRLMIGLMAIVMGFSALLNVIVQFLVAQRRFLQAYSVIIFAVLYLGGTMFFHGSSISIVLIAGLCNAGALLAGIFTVMCLKVSE